MNTISRTLAGSAMILLGVFIVSAALSEGGDGWLWGVISGLFIVILGLVIFFNKKEDDIEEINGKDNHKE